ncbi:unnamed protein product [Ascophyllum nodosum]
MRFSPATLVTRGGATPLVVLLLTFTSSPSLAEQPSWGWTDSQPPGVHRGPGRRQQQQPIDVRDTWYPEDQYVPYPDQDVDFPPLGGREEWRGSEGGVAGDRDDRSTRRQEKRGNSGKRGERGSEGGQGFDEEDEEARKDLVKVYKRSFKGRMVLSGGASLSGAMLGAFISKSTIHRTPAMTLVGLLVGLVLSVAKGAFGDLFRALGLATVLAVRRSSRLSAEYPLLPYARQALMMRPRRPFPPAENPWRYKRADALAAAEGAGVIDDRSLPPEFSMAKSLLSVAFLGGLAGYLVSQFVFLPTYLLAIGGGGFLAYLATTKNARGDLARVLGMRTVAFLGLVSEIDSDVGLSRKAKVVGGICFSTAMFWDSKYHIKDRIVALLTNLYAALAQLVRRVQKDAGAEGRGSDENDYDEDEGEFDAVLEEAFSGGRSRQKQPQSRGRRRRRQPDGRSDVEPPIPTSRPPPPPPPPPGFEGGEDSQYPGGRRGGSRY